MICDCKEILYCDTLKGVFAKNKRGYRLTSNRIRGDRYYNLVLLSVASIRRKGLKYAKLKNEGPRLIYEVAIFFTQIVNNSIKFKINH